MGNWNQESKFSYIYEIFVFPCLGFSSSAYLSNANISLEYELAMGWVGPWTTWQQLALSASELCFG